MFALCPLLSLGVSPPGVLSLPTKTHRERGKESASRASAFHPRPCLARCFLGAAAQRRGWLRAHEPPHHGIKCNPIHPAPIHSSARRTVREKIALRCAFRMSRQYWIDACLSTLGNPPNALAITLGSVVVGQCVFCANCVSPRAANPTHLLLQSATCVLCSAVSGWMFRRWWRLDDYDRGLIWKHYGWFCGLMCIGCCLAAVSFMAWAQWLVGFYQPGSILADPIVSTRHAHTYTHQTQLPRARSFVILLLPSILAVKPHYSLFAG